MFELFHPLKGTIIRISEKKETDKMVVSLPTQTKRPFNTTVKLSFDPPAIADCPLEIGYQMHGTLANTQFCW